MRLSGPIVHQFGYLLLCGSLAGMASRLCSGAISSNSKAIGTPSVVAPIDTSNRDEVVKAFHDEYRLTNRPEENWTGNLTNCLPGDLSSEFRETIVRRINFFRAMAGLPGDLTLEPTWTKKCQAAALMYGAEGRLSEEPDPTWRCYSPEAAEAAAHSNVSLGRAGPDAIDSFVDDPGLGNAAVWHRRFVLNPRMTQTGIGAVPATPGHFAAICAWLKDESQERPSEPEWVAWPPPGFVPSPLLPKWSQRWSFSCQGGNFQTARVTMTHGGTNVPVTLETFAPDDVSGESTLVWRPSEIISASPGRDSLYDVDVNSVIINGQSRRFQYRVTVIDPGPILEPPVILRQPVPQMSVVGATAMMSVEAEGSEPLSFQWRQDGVPLPGATTSELWLLHVTMDHAGTYDVLIKNAAGEARSQTVRLVVRPLDPVSFSGITILSGRAVLSWKDRALLETAPDLSGPWTAISAATSPYRVAPNQTAAFFRLRLQ